MSKLNWKALRNAVERASYRDRVEAYTAWRAGYKYLYKLWRINENFHQEAAYVPSNTPDATFPHLSVTVERFNISHILHMDSPDQGTARSLTER